MPDHEARPRAVYDHSEDEPRPGRRRRKAADWGVSEELFDGMPSRRFARRGAEHQVPRGRVEDGRRTIVIERDEPVPPADEPRDADETFASREEALRARRAHDALWGGDEPFADPATADPLDEPLEADWAGDAPSAEVGSPRSADSLPADVDSPRIAAGDSPRNAASDSSRNAGSRAAEVARGGVEGRRTVKIGGRPGDHYGPSARRRPPRTVSERLGPRPDRIAAWACALGFLLILIAILTQ